MRAVLALVVVLAGCGTSKKECATAGSRLHPRYLTTTDGLHEFIGWHDMQLDVDCMFDPGLDGTWRCVPSGDYDTTAGLYADPACTQPAIVLPSCDTTTKYHYAFAGNACTTTYMLTPVDAQLPTAYRLNGATCEASPISSGYVARALGPPVAPSEFVAGTIGKPVGTTRLRTQSLHADDGAVDACPGDLPTYDSMRAELCVPVFGDSTGYTCLPFDQAVTGNRYSDPGCSTPAVDVPKCTSPLPTYVIDLAWEQVSACETAVEPRVYPLGTAVTAEYSRTPNACSLDPFPSPDPNDHYTTGAEIPQDQFVKLTYRVQSGPGRLRPMPAGAPDGYQDRAFQYQDTARKNELCSFQIAADGMARCLPTGAITSYLFADAQCKTPLVEDSFPVGCTNPTPPAYVYSYGSGPACQSVTHLAPVTGPIAMPTSVWSNASGTCTQVLVPVGNWYSVGAEIAPSSFALGTEVIE